MQTARTQLNLFVSACILHSVIAVEVMVHHYESDGLRRNSIHAFGGALQRHPKILDLIIPAGDLAPI